MIRLPTKGKLYTIHYTHPLPFPQKPDGKQTKAIQYTLYTKAFWVRGGGGGGAGGSEPASITLFCTGENDFTSSARAASTETLQVTRLHP